MPPPEYETTPSEVRNFARLQLGLTAVFLVLIYAMIGGLGEDVIPWWLIAVLLAAVVVGAVLAERVWMSALPFAPDADPDEMRTKAVGIFAGQVVRKQAFCQAPILLAVLATFVFPYGGWPILVGAAPGLLVLAFETWPSLRNISMTEAMLNADGARAGLVESFRAW
jgi:predicted branched-subunit amino acid permease